MLDLQGEQDRQEKQKKLTQFNQLCQFFSFKIQCLRLNILFILNLKLSILNQI